MKICPVTKEGKCLWCGSSDWTKTQNECFVCRYLVSARAMVWGVLMQMLDCCLESRELQTWENEGGYCD